MTYVGHILSQDGIAVNVCYYIVYIIYISCLLFSKIIFVMKRISYIYL